MQEKAMTTSNDDYFYPGTIVNCTTCYEDVIKGEVLSFDYGTKILVLKQNSTCGKSELNNVAIINMDLIKTVVVVKEASEHNLATLSSLNPPKLLDKYRQEIKLKNSLAQAKSSGVNDDGINLYLFLNKTLPECKFVEQNLCVFDEVLIKSPYKVEDCVVKDKKILPANTCLEHVRNLVEKFHKEEKLKNSSAT